MLLALMQAQARPLDVAANLAAIDHAARDAAAAGAQLLLTPELFPLGYAPLRIHADFDMARLPDIRAALAETARRHGIGLVYSLPGDCGGTRPGISATLLDAAGTELLTYGKVHLFGGDERKAFSPASRPPGVVQFMGLNLAMVICYDVEFPETVRAAAVRGADAVLVPTALAHGFDEVPNIILRARALENHVAVAYANHCGIEDGTTFGGGSIIAGPDGGVLAAAGIGAELLYAELDADAIRGSRAGVPYLAERRPELYREWEGG